MIETMATYQEAIVWMQDKPQNTASHDAQYQYRIRNGQIERGTWQGNTLWLPHVPSNDLIISDKWDLLEPF